MSPEVAISKHGRAVIQKLRKKITVVAIDEAHCIHEWYDTKILYILPAMILLLIFMILGAKTLDQLMTKLVA